MSASPRYESVSPWTSELGHQQWSLWGRKAWLTCKDALAREHLSPTSGTVSLDVEMPGQPCHSPSLRSERGFVLRSLPSASCFCSSWSFFPPACVHTASTWAWWVWSVACCKAVLAVLVVHPPIIETGISQTPSRTPRKSRLAQQLLYSLLIRWLLPRSD